MMNMELIVQYFTYALMAVGILAFVVSMVTQVIKEMPGLVQLPTSAVVLIVSLIVCLLAVVIFCQCCCIAMLWYYWVAAVIAAFIVYLVATGGWDRVMSIWERTKYNKQ